MEIKRQHTREIYFLIFNDIQCYVSIDWKLNKMFHEIFALNHEIFLL